MSILFHTRSKITKFKDVKFNLFSNLIQNLIKFSGQSILLQIQIKF